MIVICTCEWPTDDPCPRHADDSPERMKPMDLREDMTLAIQPKEGEPYMVRVASVEENEDGSFTVTTKPFGDLPPVTTYLSDES